MSDAAERRFRSVGATWVGLGAVYLLFAGQISRSEMLAGVAAAAAAAALAYAQPRPGRRLELSPRAFGALGAACLGLVLDTVRVGSVLARAIRARPVGSVGQVTRQPFRHGGAGGREAGRRAVVTLATSLAPNGYALCLPPGEDTLLLHRLAPAPPGLDTEWPG